jgi:hypothetical protein
MNALKKNWYFVIPVALLLLPLVMTGYISMTYGYTMADAWTAFKTAGEADTKFQTPKYSERGFSKVTVGMQGREVYELIGQPLERHGPDQLIWHYSRPVRDARYFHERTLIMEPGTGKVASIINRYHIPE